MKADVKKLISGVVGEIEKKQSIGSATNIYNANDENKLKK